MKKKPNIGDEAATTTDERRPNRKPTLFKVTKVLAKTMEVRSVYGGSAYQFYHDGRPFRGTLFKITFDPAQIAKAKAAHETRQKEQAEQERKRAEFENHPCFPLARKLVWGHISDRQAMEQWMKLGTERLNTIIGWLESEGISL